jgi:hypothetical protein
VPALIGFALLLLARPENLRWPVPSLSAPTIAAVGCVLLGLAAVIAAAGALMRRQARPISVGPASAGYGDK